MSRGPNPGSLGIPGFATSPNAPEQTWVPVLSSFLKKIMYIGPRTTRQGKFSTPGRLWIQFWTKVSGGGKIPGPTFVYHAVPPSIWAGLLAASSKGGYFHVAIKGNFAFARVG